MHFYTFVFIGTTNVLILYSYCTQTVLILYSDCAHTVLRLYSDCTHTVLIQYSDCTSVQRLGQDREAHSNDSIILLQSISVDFQGPFIASVTLAAYECNSLDFPEPPYPNR